MPYLAVTIRLIITISILCLISGVIAAGQLSPGLARATTDFTPSSSADSLVEVIVFLDDTDLKRTVFKSVGSSKLTSSERATLVTSQLQDFEAPHKSSVRQYLAGRAASSVKEHWIIPALTVTVRVSEVAALSELDGVTLVVENAALVYEEPVKVAPALSTATAAVSTELSLLNVPELWQRGLKGKGSLVCSFDTGVERDHVALSDKWRGNHAALTSAWFSIVAPDSLPYDPIGHGTHTTGVMVGAAEADSFGVAPEAEWIAAGVVDQGRTLAMTLSDIIEAFQWAVNPDRDVNTTDDVPDVILNSWGIPKGLFAPCDDTFWGMIDYVEAAGIVTIFSAGNEGPEPMTLRSPADRASTPLNAFAVGAVDNTLVIGSFSSRGPSSCDTTQIKPEVVAPGVSIRSCFKDGGYTLMTGTSMAAPYVAGLVALVRQYNPNATVEQIKNAFIQAAQDLGDAGNDNAYGHGFVDAARVLDFIDPPQLEGFYLSGYQISGDGIADPGESFELTIALNNVEGDLGSLIGQILPLQPELAQTLSGEADFDFGVDGTSAENSIPYEIVFDASVFNGQRVGFRLLLSGDGVHVTDSLEFDITAGIDPVGTIATHQNTRIRLSVSDFGQFGFAPGSMYNVMGDGFCFDGSGNLLYEAGVVVALDDTRVASSIRDEYGLFRPSDFAPMVSLSDEWMGPDGGLHRSATFNDASGDVPVYVSQETIHYAEEGLVLIRYTVENRSSERMTSLRLGLLVDLDLSESDEMVIDKAADLVYQRGSNGVLVGMVALRNASTLASLSNTGSKTGFTESELAALMSSTDFGTDAADGDVMFLGSSDAFVIDPLRTARVSFALVGGGDLQELYANAELAKDKLLLASGFDSDRNDDQPSQFKLYQNYPNPFNPITTISFAVMEPGHFSLEVFNILGQKVSTLHAGYLASGLHQFDWQSTDDNGRTVANGIYFYRLQGESTSVSRKMLLVK